ncbi:LysR family transcriptional regulator [Streptomyces sp. NBC_00989]|uniref:LysR family transcriptional regulator n=1 Tax=Streptomyces sp. NBC_00989 TaxID=2903705 RepID=UPI00386F5775|nr:LysR family transcriptional regulator [Streptomyces sp. NBC_00989]
MSDLDLRLVRCFTVVAEELHFGRAAAVLHLAQPSLSRHIRRLEGELGVRLLDRTTQGTRLTEAGAAFLPRAQALLRSAAEAAAVAREVGQPSRIVIGFMTGLIITPAVRALRAGHPEADVHSRFLGWGELPSALLEHRVHVVVGRLPFATEGLSVSVLYEEPRVLLMPVGHRLAGKEYVTLDDIADEPVPRFPDEEFNAFWRVDPRPDGRPAPDGPFVREFEDKLEVIAAGEAVALVPAGAVKKGLRLDLTTVPIEGAPPVPVVLAVRAGEERRPLLAAFRACAEDHLTPANWAATDAG